VMGAGLRFYALARRRHLTFLLLSERVEP
jgi:hypothetical protein